MNRRDFFKRLSTSLVTAYVATSLPFDWLPNKARVEGLQMIMTKAFNEFVKGKRSADWGHIKIEASHKVFEQFSSEIQQNQRFTSTDYMYSGIPTLMFKSAIMTNSGSKDGFWFTITDGTRTSKHYL